MPLIVDHAKRRAEVVEIAINLIAERGLEGVNVRAIAQRAGYSTAIVSHYFHNKAELLFLAFETTIEQTGQRVDEALASLMPTFDILVSLLPLDPLAARNWKIWFAFWGMALSDPRYLAAQITRSREGQAIIRRVLEQCGEITHNAAGGREMQASRLFAMIGGIASQSILDPEGWPPERQRGVLSAEFEALQTH